MFSVGTIASPASASAERRPDVAVHRDIPAGPTFTGLVLKVDGLPDLAVSIDDHLPGQGGYLLGSEASLQRQKENSLVSG